MLFIITALILGLFISTITDSQMTAMFIAMVGMFLPTVMLSGFMFPIENMPLPLRIMSNVVPAKWYFIIVKSIMIKGLGISAIIKELGILFGMMIIFWDSQLEISKSGWHEFIEIFITKGIQSDQEKSSYPEDDVHHASNSTHSPSICS